MSGPRPPRMGGPWASRWSAGGRAARPRVSRHQFRRMNATPADSDQEQVIRSTCSSGRIFTTMPLAHISGTFRHRTLRPARRPRRRRSACRIHNGLRSGRHCPASRRACSGAPGPVPHPPADTADARVPSRCSPPTSRSPGGPDRAPAPGAHPPPCGATARPSAPTPRLLDTGPITAGRLAEITGLTTGAVTAIVDRLKRAGYLRRERDPGDRRKVVIHPVWTPERAAPADRSSYR